MEPEAPRETPIACDLAALDSAQRERHRSLLTELHSALQEIRELPDGYAFKFPSGMCVPAAEFISLERLCCPFVSFALELEREGGPLWLRMTGREGVKPFLEIELGIRTIRP